MDSFNKFSEYGFSFKELDKRLSKNCTTDKYYQRWMGKYAKIFKNDCLPFTVIEWDLRNVKALREIFASATFYVEAQKDIEMGCFASYYFCMYYSLFHALYSLAFLDANTGKNALLNITHQNLINVCINAFASSKDDILSKDVKGQYYDLQYKREYFSYVTPLNNLFDLREDLNKLKKTLYLCYQLSAFHSLMVDKSFCKHVKKVVKITTEDELYDTIDLFEAMFSKRPKSEAMSKRTMDPSAENIRTELLRDGARPTYFALDLEHQFDEFHTYDSSFDESDKQKDAAAAMIYSFIYQAINV